MCGCKCGHVAHFGVHAGMRVVYATGGGSGPNEMGPNEFYPYAEILQRVYDAISEKNPELLGECFEGWHVIFECQKRC